MVGGNQSTLTWHVDDLKVSHVDGNVTQNFICDMEMVFGKETPLSVSHGEIHDYLGMMLEFEEPGWVIIRSTFRIEK